MKVRSVMHRGATCVQPDTPVREIARRMRRYGRLGDATVTATLLEDADLHDHLAKGLYEAKLAA